MLFSSLSFLFYFLPVAFLCYFAAPRPYRNGILFFFSLVFYAWGEPIYVMLMLFSTFVDFVFGYLVDKHRGTPKSKQFLICAVAINLLLLCFFKYSDFIVANINGLFGLDIPLLHLPLPIGISFYTFQTMSYTIDIYRGDAKMQPDIIKFGTYVTMFPQLMAGPIVRYSDIATQLDHRIETPDMMADGIRRFIAGLAKKILLADNIGAVWTQLSSLPTSQQSVLGVWLGIIAYGFQIYFDFSGYSDMAIGLGKMMGFDLLENFNYPYISKSITEFWRRWHISLGTWFRMYVYIPLGGNRKGLAVQLRNIGIVWLLTGIWHGASWNFAIWGLYYAVLMMLEKVFLLKVLQKAPRIVAHCYALFFVTISWAIFAFEDFSQLFLYLKQMFGVGVPLVSSHALFALSSNWIPLVCLIIGSTPWPSRWYKQLLSRWQNRTTLATIASNGVLTLLLLASVAYLVDSTLVSFLYFRF